jgi:N-acetyltransferase
VAILDPELCGRHVRLEPLQPRHLPGLVAASAGDPDLYRMSKVPVGDAEVAKAIEVASAARQARMAAPFAVIRLADEVVIGSRSAIRTGANTEMKQLMLTLAFETWEVQSVCFHTDARNERSRRALARIGARYEGILRAHRLAADDRPRDSARFSITAADWPAIRAHLDELSQDRVLAS